VSGRAIGSHQSATAGTDIWLTPPDLLRRLGSFDLDPCAAPPPRPWPTAARHIALPDDGLSAVWAVWRTLEGKVCLCPCHLSASPSTVTDARQRLDGSAAALSADSGGQSTPTATGLRPRRASLTGVPGVGPAPESTPPSRCENDGQIPPRLSRSATRGTGTAELPLAGSGVETAARVTEASNSGAPRLCPDCSTWLCPDCSTCSLDSKPRVFLNPPYSDVGRWLGRLSAHGQGTALIFARTETALFTRYVWQKATAALFLTGRITFCRPSGRPGKGNSGAPSVLVAYGQADAGMLRDSGIPGAFVSGWSCAGQVPVMDSLFDLGEAS
jgi:hypothetical protein